MSLDTLKDLYVTELKDIYSAEQQLLKVLPKLSKAATSEELSTAFDEHFDQTREHVGRLEQIFGMLKIAARGKKCVAMEGLVEEGKEVLEMDGGDSVKDAAIIASAQKVEHYEMATYGCLRTWAGLLGFDEQAALLEETLAEEKAADHKLTEIAEESINPDAESEAEETERDTEE